MEALEDIPKIEGPLLTEKGEATLQKTDIFRKIMWFGFNEENTWYPLNIQRVNQILRMNQEGKKPATLDLDVEAEKIPVETLNSDLARMDQKFKGKSKKGKRKKVDQVRVTIRHVTIGIIVNPNRAISDEDSVFVNDNLHCITGLRPFSCV